jgi:hypothetical protein
MRELEKKFTKLLEYVEAPNLGNAKSWKRHIKILFTLQIKEHSKILGQLKNHNNGNPDYAFCFSFVPVGAYCFFILSSDALQCGESQRFNNCFCSAWKSA